VLKDTCEDSVEYVFTCTPYFGNILLILGIVYTNVKLQCTSLKIYNNIQYKNVYIFSDFVSNHCRCVKFPVDSYMDAVV
jgi:hypothetical protein